MLKYLPDRATSSRPLERDYAYAILATIKPHFVREIVNNAINKRNGVIKSKIEPSSVVIDDEMVAALTEYP